MKGAEIIPYGYSEYRLKNGISEKTVLPEAQMLKSMLIYVNSIYKRPVEPHEIRPSDIKSYLDDQRKQGIQDSTVRRKLIYIRNFFNYLWEINKIPIDFMPKLKYSKQLDLKSKDISLDYSKMLERQKDFLTSARYPLNAKIAYLFYMRGIRVRDLYELTVSDFNDLGNEIVLKFETYSGLMATYHFKEAEEINVILSAIERSIFRGVNYILSSKVKGVYTQFQPASMSDYIELIAAYLGHPFKSEQIRFAYVKHLYTVEKLSIEQIQERMGITFETTTRILKEALERVKVVDYTVKRTS
ncbi:MAG: site-specific integrase [Paenisporosarcina sp.]|nr:site-specific integrase [Paenisporosarcina sp.]